MGVSVIGVDWVLGNTAVECLGEGGLVRPIHAQPLVTKCRAEPTGVCWGGAVSLMQEKCLLGHGYLELTGYGAPLRI
jgi:hypothetical protein